MKHLSLTIASLLALPAPAWAHPGFTDVNGCHTDRNWERHCHETATQVTHKSIDSALARAKARTATEHQAMEEARARAKVSGRVPSGHRKAAKDGSEGQSLSQGGPTKP